MPPTVTPKTCHPIPFRDFSENEKRKLLNLIDASAGPEGCWPIKSKLNAHGYGQIMFDRVQYGAHRVALHLAIPCHNVEMNALHSCDNRKCCNPSHLRWGTAKDNAVDRQSRGRGIQLTGERHWSKLHPEKVLKGEQRPSSKLNWEKVKLIREIYVPNKVSYIEIAKKFGVSASAIIRVANHVTWKTT